MLSLCKQIIWEWGNSGGTLVTIERDAPEILEKALRSCSIEPTMENLSLLDQLIYLMQCKTCCDDE